MVAHQRHRERWLADAFCEGGALGARPAGLEDTAAQHQPHDRDQADHQAKVSPAAAGRKLSDDYPDRDQRQGEPVGPAQQRNLRGNDDDERDDADENREKVEHVSYIGNTDWLFKMRN